LENTKSIKHKKKHPKHEKNILMKTLPQRKNMKNFKNMKNIGRGREVGGKFHDKAYPRGNPSSTG